MEGFHFSNGKTAHNLGELSAIVETSENHVFEEHVSSERNDFANWVEHCLYDKPLADELRKTTNRIQTILLLRSAMHKVSAPAPTEQPKPVDNVPEPRPVVSAPEPARMAQPHPLPPIQEPPRPQPIAPPAQLAPPVAPELPKLPPLLETPAKKRFLEQGGQREFLFGFLIGVIFGVLAMHVIRTFLL